MEALGPINMLAVQEHEEEDRRLQFLLEQRDDLMKARETCAGDPPDQPDGARAVHATPSTRCARTSADLQSLFQGGECDVWLADHDDPLESPIELLAQPPGKKTQRSPCSPAASAR